MTMKDGYTLIECSDTLIVQSYHTLHELFTACSQHQGFNFYYFEACISNASGIIGDKYKRIIGESSGLLGNSKRIIGKPFEHIRLRPKAEGRGTQAKYNIVSIYSE